MKHTLEPWGMDWDNPRAKLLVCSRDLGYRSEELVTRFVYAPNLREAVTTLCRIRERALRVGANYVADACDELIAEKAEATRTRERR